MNFYTYKHNFWMPALALAAAFTLVPGAHAQTSGDAAGGDHVVVPLSHPSQPMTLKLSMLMGSITVKGGSGKDVIIDSSASDESRRQRRAEPADTAGMHRLTTNAGFTAEEDNNVVRISTSVVGGGNLEIQVPQKASLDLSTVNGGMLSVSNVDGDLNLRCTNGSIQLNQVAGSIVANAMNGKITATITRLDAAKPSSFSSMNGTIEVTLPADAKASLTMRSDQGDIFIDDAFNLQQVHASSSASGGSSSSSSDAESGSGRDRNGMFRVKIDRTVHGTINGGGAEVRFQDFNGNILLHKAK